MLKKMLLTLAIIALISVGASAQLALKVSPDKTSTKIEVTYTGTAAKGVLPQMVFLGISQTLGNTTFPFAKIPFITNDLVLGLDKAFLFAPIKLDKTGKGSMVLPFGTATGTIYKFQMQAVYLKLNFDLTVKGIPLKGTFIPSNIVKDVAIGIGKRS